MEYSDDPWNSPDVHKHHKHAQEEPAPPIAHVPEEQPVRSPPLNGHGDSNGAPEPTGPPARTTSTFTTASIESAGEPEPAPTRQESFPPATSPGVGWGAGDFFGGTPAASNPVTSPFGAPVGIGVGREHGEQRPGPISNRMIGSGRTGSGVEEHIVVNLLPEKEGMFMFQHHNYEVVSARRGSKVIRRYSDFVWLLDCLHKRYPFRVLPLLPPKRVAGKSSLPLLADNAYRRSKLTPHSQW